MHTRKKQAIQISQVILELKKKTQQKRKKYLKYLSTGKDAKQKKERKYNCQVFRLICNKHEIKISVL